jgi:CP family cyanate transporter-like MFS transporter
VTDPDRHGGTSLAGLRGLAALVVVGLTLRTQLTVIGPILPRIQQDIDVVHAAAGLLTGLPLLCMGLAAFAAPGLVTRLGAPAAVAGALGIVGVFGTLRAVAPEALSIYVATLLVGIGIGIGGTSVPVFVKQRFGGHPAGATGTNVTAIILGSGIVASTAVPLADALGSWRWPLAVSSVLTVAAAVAWYVLVGGQGRTARGAGGRLPLRSRVAWLLVVVFCLQSLLFFGLATWLPAAYVERGWDEAAAANLVGILIVTGLPASLGVGWLADRFGSRRLYLVASGAVTLVCCLGFVTVPDLGLLWAAIVGVPLGALFALALTLPLDASPRPADVGSLTGLMLGVGYLAAAATPVVMGAVRDALGTFSASLGLLAVAAAGLTALSLAVTDSRLAGAREQVELATRDRERAAAGRDRL